MSSGWNTIVSEPGVFTKLVQNLGVKNVEIEELYALDADSLRQVAPIHAVIFLFKYSSIDREYARRNVPIDGEYDPYFQQKGIFFAQQTIQNACATLAVLNALFNSTNDVDVGDELSNFRLFTVDFDPEMCGVTLTNSEVIRTIHNSFSAPRFIDTGDEQNRPQDEQDDGLFHFIAYVNIKNTIYELDGLKQYPIQHEALSGPEDFCEKLPQVLQRRISKYEGEIRYSLLAITNDKLKQYQQLGDVAGVEQEKYKREQWDYEINLRKHEYSRLTAALVKNIFGNMSDAEWAAVVCKAKSATMKRMVNSTPLLVRTKAKNPAA